MSRSRSSERESEQSHSVHQPSPPLHRGSLLKASIGTEQTPLPTDYLTGSVSIILLLP